MRNALTIVAAALLVSGMVSTSFAGMTQHQKTQAAPEVVYGSVVSVDTASKQIVVLDEKTSQNRTFVISQKAAALVKAGERVEVKVKSGTSTASSVTILKKKSNKK